MDLLPFYQVSGGIDAESTGEQLGLGADFPLHAALRFDDPACACRPRLRDESLAVAHVGVHVVRQAVNQADAGREFGNREVGGDLELGEIRIDVAD